MALAGTGPAEPVAGLIAACYIAENLDAFLQFWHAHPDFAFLLVATLKGELVDQRGLIYGGHQKKPAGGIVQREIDLRETARELTATRRRTGSSANALKSWARRWPQPKPRWSSSASTC